MFKKYILELVVFLSGAAVMIMELVGSRILAPYLGTSIVVWTSLIGIILGFLSLGYYLGGKIADKNPNYKIFSFIIFLGAIFVGLIAVGQSSILNIIQREIVNIYFGTIIATIVLFAVPSTLLGMVSPYAVRLKMENVEKSGETVGNLYAISTIGSIVGTFSAGFLLIPFLGSIKILFILSVGLVLTSILAYSKNFLRPRIISIAFFLILYSLSYLLSANFNIKNIIDIDTQYSRIWLVKAVDRLTGRPILSIINDPRGIQSSVYLDNDDDLVHEYTKYYRLAEHFNPDIKSSLMIGGSGYSYPKDYLKKYNEATIDVVEIDPRVTEIARKYFNLIDNKRLTIIHEDGRTFLNKNDKKYDAAFIDAFTSYLSIPYQMSTVEMVQKLYNSLNENGVVLVNIISAFEGEKGYFLRAEYLTYKNVFDQVYLLPVGSNNNPKRIQNIMLVALKSQDIPKFSSENEEYNGYLKNIWEKEIKADVPILTDDYAPVDYYTMKLFDI